MAGRSRGPVRFVRPKPRTKMWIGFGVGSTSISGNSATLIATLSAGALLLRPFTILRTRGIIAYRSDQVAASENPFGTFADLVVTDTAAALGITAIPDPGSDPESRWWVFQELHSHFRLLSSVGFESVQGSGHVFTIDDKAMRKVGPDEDVAGVASQLSAVGATIYTRGRRLIQLH